MIKTKKMKRNYTKPQMEVASLIKVSSIICGSENGTGADSGPTKHRHYYDPEDDEQKEPSYGSIW